MTRSQHALRKGTGTGKPKWHAHIANVINYTCVCLLLWHFKMSALKKVYLLVKAVSLVAVSLLMIACSTGSDALVMMFLICFECDLQKIFTCICYQGKIEPVMIKNHNNLSDNHCKIYRELVKPESFIMINIRLNFLQFLGIANLYELLLNVWVSSQSEKRYFTLFVTV